MTILNRLYASGGSEVEIETLQIRVNGEDYWLTKGWDDIEAKLEDGRLVTFIACGMDIALPARNEDGTQDLKFAISNIDGIVSGAIREAIDKYNENPNGTLAEVTYRQYFDVDLTAPNKPPFTLTVKSGQWTWADVQITAGYMNILDTAWPRHRYNLAEHSGLRYLS
ncbi:DUF1833 family protein [Providencia rettgeri]